MGAHWFDRLARVHAASSQAAVGASAELTRRDALVRAGAVTLGLGAVGAFGALPVAASAAPRGTARASDAQLAACGKCNKANDERTKASERRISRNFLRTAPTPAVTVTTAIWIAEMIGAEAARYAGLRECANGVCNPQSYAPAPSATPATDVETGAPSCPPGTSDCGEAPGTGSHYCCFGNDVCCSGTCCIADVGCACAPR